MHDIMLHHMLLTLYTSIFRSEKEFLGKKLMILPTANPDLSLWAIVKKDTFVGDRKYENN